MIRFLIVALLIVALPCQAASLAEEPQYPIDPAMTPPMSSAELETVIDGLNQPVDQEQLSKIFFELGRLEDPNEQARLQQLLDARMQELFQTEQNLSVPDAGAMMTFPSDGVSAEPSVDELRMRMHTLTLGPAATAEDLRVRDDLVAAIAGLADPITRDELLHELEERERQAETFDPTALTLP